LRPQAFPSVRPSTKDERCRALLTSIFRSTVVTGDSGARTDRNAPTDGRGKDHALNSRQKRSPGGGRTLVSIALAFVAGTRILSGCGLPSDDGLVLSCFGLVNQSVPGTDVVPNPAVVTNLYFGGCSPQPPK
jgi:hypothetical protein